MKIIQDCIQFEYRSEINEIEAALGTYLEDHPNERNKEAVKELISLLDAMYISW